ncbi:MAG: hypothetical protein ACO4CG_06040 [Prochlorothrix sp.]
MCRLVGKDGGLRPESIATSVEKLTPSLRSRFMFCSPIPIRSTLLSLGCLTLWHLAAIPATAPAANATPRPIAQLFYPPTGQPPGIQVVGRGQASQPADRATLQFYIYRDSYYFDDGFGESFEESRQSPQHAPTQFSPQTPAAIPSYAQASPTPVSRFQPVEHDSWSGEPDITATDLEPLLNALVEQGVKPSQITQELGTLDAYTATVTVELSQPSQSQVKAIVETVEKSLFEQEPLFLQEVSVVYGVEDCRALEADAYGAAVMDGAERAGSIAANLGVELVDPPSVAESLFNLVVPGCSSNGPEFPDFFNGFGGSGYDPTQPAEVEVLRDVFMTYPVR